MLTITSGYIDLNERVTYACNAKINVVNITILSLPIEMLL